MSKVPSVGFPGRARSAASMTVPNACSRLVTLSSRPWLADSSAPIALSSGDDRALFAGDIMHTPLQVTHPDHSSCFDLDPAQSRTTRLRLLGWAAENNALILPAHFSGHSALEVEDTGSGFGIKRWGPLPRY